MVFSNEKLLDAAIEYRDRNTKEFGHTSKIP